MDRAAESGQLLLRNFEFGLLEAIGGQDQDATCG
jgi:hypothetical protein